MHEVHYCENILSSPNGGTLSDSVLLELGISRSPVQNTALFPNLKTLFVETPLLSRSLGPFLQLLLSEKLVDLEINGENGHDSESEIVSLISYASHLSPSLRTLRLWNSDSTNPYSSKMNEALGRAIAQCKLDTYQTDTQALSNPVFSALALQEKLVNITLLWEAYLSIDTIRVPAVFAAIPETHSFSSLRHLDIRLCRQGIENVFGKVDMFPSLCCLTLHAVLNSDQTELNGCIRRISTSCPKLKELDLFRHDCLPTSASSVNVVLPTRSGSANGLGSFASLSSLPNLLRLRINHYWPLRFDNIQLLDLARRLPKLVTLCLNPEPIRLRSFEQRITYSVLPELACALPKLKELRLFIDAPGDAQKDFGPVSRTFSKLKTLSFGTSPLPADPTVWGGIIVLLGQLIPSGCKICTEPVLEDFRVRAGDVETFLNRRKEWGKLSGLLQSTIRVRSLVVGSIKEGRSRMEDWHD